MWSQAERDRVSLENELGLRHEADRERIMEEANQRANEIIKVVCTSLALRSLLSIVTKDNYSPTLIHAACL